MWTSDEENVFPPLTFVLKNSIRKVKVHYLRTRKSFNSIGGKVKQQGKFNSTPKIKLALLVNTII